MFYASIDIVKLNYFASTISYDGEVLIGPFRFTYSADGFHLLISKLDFFEQNNNIIGLKSTAHYGDNLVGSSFKICVLKPIKTSTMRKNNIRKLRQTRLTLLLAPAQKSVVTRTHRFPIQISCLHSQA